MKKGYVLWVAMIVAVSATGIGANAAERHEMYAPPVVYGPWMKVSNHIGRISYKIRVQPVVGVTTQAEVRYFDDHGQQIKQTFNSSVSFTTGNSVSSIEVRLRTLTASGVSCTVDVTAGSGPRK